MRKIGLLVLFGLICGAAALIAQSNDLLDELLAEERTSFETEKLTILATEEIIFEAPVITFNTPVANFTGQVRAEGGTHSNSTNVAPSGARGRAGTIPANTAIRTPGI